MRDSPPLIITLQAEASCFQMWYIFFWWFSGEVDHIEHPIRMNELEQLFNAHLWVWPTTVPSRDWRTILFLGAESHQSLTFLFFLVHHLGFIMWPWNPSTSWPTPSPSSCPPPPPSTASPWTAQHLPSHHSSPLLGQPPSLTMPPTTTLPFSQSPPEHALCTPHIFTYTGPIDSQRQRSHLSHLLLHDLRGFP